MRRRLAALLLLASIVPAGATGQAASARPDPADRALIRRTEFGVPHIEARDLEAAGFALAWVQSEDYGERVPMGLVRARGEVARWLGPDSLDDDVIARWVHGRAVATWDSLPPDVRAMYRGFADGVNRYVRTHRDAMPEWMPADFTGPDVAARDVGSGGWGGRDRIAARIETSFDRRPDVGSNAWAIAPSRTRSGHAILLRNPHLSWDAGYYEAHVTVPDTLDFYGDFRIGGPFGIIGGFNARLGWATTNNYPDTDELYALDADPDAADAVRFGGRSVPLRRIALRIPFRNGDAVSTETRELWMSPIGPVVHRAHGMVYVLRDPSFGVYRVGEQFLRMMESSSLAQWKDAMRIHARGASNFTYADADGHIFYVWNSLLPELPRPSGGDTAAVPARSWDDVWTRVVPWDSLPQVQDPKQGFLHNENDPYMYATPADPLPRLPYPSPAPKLRLRSQLSIDLLRSMHGVTLEDVVRRKHSYRMLLAERVKDDLVRAVRASHPAPDVARAADLVDRWDETVAPDSRGAVLFVAWWERYLATTTSAPATPASAGFGAPADSLFAQPWSPEQATTTPRGLSNPARAASAFAWAVDETARKWGRPDVAWGDVHRIRVGDVDLPAGGCNGDLGCFRVLWYRDAPDGKLAARGGDGWVLAVEFGRRPRAYSVLAYGESDLPGSTHHTDQTAMFARGELKPVRFTPADVRAHTVREYRPNAASADEATPAGRP